MTNQTTPQNTPIELHYWTTPNGKKISIMLEELGVAYTLRMINIGRGDQFAPEFLALSPNNRIPAILDPEGPGGKPISVFESGAILQYLGRKFARFYPVEERARTQVDEWLHWQIGGFGPMLGQNHHFTRYAAGKSEYATRRYQDETHRLYGVLNQRLGDRDFVAGDYSIADMAIIGWALGWEGQTMDIEEFPNVKGWLARMTARPGVERGLAAGADEATKLDLADDEAARDVLFNQRSRTK